MYKCPKEYRRNYLRELSRLAQAVAVGLLASSVFFGIILIDLMR